ncbi:MAG: short-chain dehydrogenase [Gammaproteobacteria bacterium HGW-Gammaproteobacteria-3]|nr:MAG: short-chain dehydrogenase [Gammaproteobacteria bacterium HGW-Gammaproteobacteria-3]
MADIKQANILNYPVLALGFRAFFMLAGFSAVLLILLWNAVYKGALTLPNYFAPSDWHGHEMLVGYASAVIAGFLLTAVRNWTGLPTATGKQLAALCLLWLYGRILPFYAGLLPDMLIALVDFAFLPALAYQIGKPVIKSRNLRSTVFLLLLALMAFANALIHLEMLGFLADSAQLGLQLLIATIITLILLVAGRVFPFFTERGLSGTLAIRNPFWDALSITSAVLVFVLLMAKISGIYLVVVAVFAALANTRRILDWYVQKVWYVPLLWILYIGYGWIILGFVLTALAAYNLIPLSLALHAFTLGGIGVLTLGMMARVSLGHTGRALKASNAIAIAFVLINVSAFFRVLLPAAFPAGYGPLLYIATLCWLAAFSLFLFVYAPILTRTRADGRPD